MEMEGDEGMMETEEEWGTAPVASSTAGDSEMEKSEEWGVVGLGSPIVRDDSSVGDDIFDPARVLSSAGTLYEKVAAGAFESILDEKNYTSAQQQQQMVEEVVACLPYLVRVALANPAHSILFQKLHALPQLNSVLAYLALDIDAVEDPVEAELQRKRKSGSMNPSEGSLVAQYGERLVSEFEIGTEEVKLRLFLSELHNVMDHVRLANASKSRGATRSYPVYHSEIFGDELYLEELGFILPIAMLRVRRAPLSLEAVIEALLCVDLGGRLLRILFFNMPALRDEILLALIKCASSAQQRVTEILLDLCSLSVTVALFVRTWIMQQHLLPDLALQLTLTHIKDEVAFMSGLLHDHKWIDSYFNEQQSGSPVILLRARLLTMIVEFEGIVSARPTLPAHQRIRLTALLKLYCGLVGLLKLKLEGEEMNAILSLLMKVKDERIAKLGLCWLLVCEGLLRHCSKDAVVSCLSSLLKSGHCLEMLSLLAIHFHTNQISSAIELIRETLGLTVSIHSESLNQIAAVFTEDLFTEEVVAKEAVALAVRPKLSDKDTKSFAVMCIYHLLKNKIFSKHRVDVGEWVWSQITQADEPIHYLLPALIEEWVKSILAPTTSFCMKRPLEEQITAVFRTSPKRKRGTAEKEKEEGGPPSVQLTPVDELTSHERATQVLALYFALYYNEEVLRQSTEDRSRSGQRAVFSPGKQSKGNTVRAYSGELMESLPVKALLSHARERSADTYSNIYPPLLNLVISQFPGLLTVVNILNDEEQKSSTIKEFLNIPHFNFVDANMRPTDDESSSPLAQEKPAAPDHAVVKSAFESVLTSPMQTQFMLAQLSRLSVSQLQAYTDLLVFTLLPLLLEDDVQHRVRVQFVELWELWHTLTPFESALKSINAITPEPSSTAATMDHFPAASAHKGARRGGMSHYSHMDIVMDPLMVFRCDPRLFRIPPLFKMLLQILDTYLTESHKYINTLLSVEPATGHAEKGTRHEDLVTLLHAQDTAVIQLLLEVCIDRDHSPIKGPMEEVRIQSCTFIHQMFCESPQLMKLVHLQGYPEELLPVTVYGIPSIHVALEFLPELLSQPQPERLVFAIKLAGYLIEKYTLPKCIDLARMVLQKIHATTVASDDPRAFLMETLPSLARIANTFPAQLCEDTVGLLQEVSTIAGRSAAVGGVAMAHPQLHAQIQATFAALAARATDPMA